MKAKLKLKAKKNMRVKGSREGGKSFGCLDALYKLFQDIYIPRFALAR